MTKNYKELLHQIRAFVFDMDGTLTSGHFSLTPEGQPLRNLYSKDGYGMQLAIKKGFIVAVISGGRCDGVKASLQRLGLTDIYMGYPHKLNAWQDLLAVYEHQNLQERQILYMGDDIPDFHLLQRAGIGAAPANAAPEIRELAQYVSPHKGGEGCVRDVIEQTLKLQGNWMLEEDFAW